MRVGKILLYGIVNNYQKPEADIELATILNTPERRVSVENVGLLPRPPHPLLESSREILEALWGSVEYTLLAME